MLNAIPLKSLTLYLISVLSVIAPKMAPERSASIANDIAAVSLSETRAFEDDANGQKTALLLTSIAYYETGKSWAAWIDDGRCNSPMWRAAHEKLLSHGDCDGGLAWSMWQVHVHGDSWVRGRALINNRQTAIRVALASARASLKRGVGLCAYSGEHWPNCKLARTRLETARVWQTKFPFKPDALDEVASGL